MNVLNPALFRCSIPASEPCLVYAGIGIDQAGNAASGRSTFRARGRGSFPIIVDFDLGASDRIAYRLCPLLGIFAHNDLFLDACFLSDDCFLGRCRHLDRPLTERLCGSRCNIRRPIDRTAFNMNALLPQVYLLLDGLFDNIAPHAHTASPDLTLADPKLLLVNRDNLFLTATRCPGRRKAGTRTRGGGRCHATSRRAALALPCSATLMHAGPPALAPVCRMGFHINCILALQQIDYLLLIARTGA